MTKFTPAYFDGLQIVVIDDDESSLDVLTILLEFVGATIIGAENGKIGLEKIRTAQPDLVICDISMPILDGWGVIEQLRGANDAKDLIVIALTAHAMVGDRERILAAGFNEYMTKPIDPPNFVDHLLKVLEKAESAK